jgi:Fe-S-cluster-containing hydrogenase component 2
MGKLKGHITIDRELCKECHLCIHACKKGLIAPSHEYNSRGYRPVIFKEEGLPRITREDPELPYPVIPERPFR